MVTAAIKTKHLVQRRTHSDLGVHDPDEQKIEHMNVLTIGRERTGEWIAIEGMAKSEDIGQTVLRFTARRARATGESRE